MVVDPLKYISLEEAEDLVKRSLNNQGDGIDSLGTIIIDSIPEVVQALMEKWIERFEPTIAKEYDKNGYSNRYQQLIRQRGITFNEYQRLFDSELSEDDFDYYPVFEWLEIDSELGYYDDNGYVKGRKDYTLEYDPTLDDYCRLLASRSLATLETFSNKLGSIAPYPLVRQGVFACGASGSGKSQMLRAKIRHLEQKYRPSIFLIDPHGKLAEEVYYSDLHKDHKTVAYFDTDFKDGYTPVFNPLETKVTHPRKINRLALRLSRSLEEIIDGEMSPNMRAILFPCLSILLKQPNTNLQDLRNFVDKRKNEELINLGKQTNDPEYINVLETINDGDLSRARTAIRNKLNSLLTQADFKYLTTGKSKILLDDIFDKRTTKIFNFGEMDDETKEAYGRLLISTIVDLAQRRGVVEDLPDREAPPIFLIIDECHLFLSESIVKILTQMRKYKLHLILCTQHIAQLREGTILDDILGNTAVKFIGYNDSPSTIGLLTGTLGIDKKEFASLKNYHWIVKVRGRTDYRMKSSDALLKGDFMLSRDERKKLDNYMLQKYYSPISVVKTDIAFEEAEVTKSRKEPIDLSKLSIDNNLEF